MKYAGPFGYHLDSRKLIVSYTAHDQGMPRYRSGEGPLAA